MENNPYQTRQPNISENVELRIPQREGYYALTRHVAVEGYEREVGIIMPVGCGKSGLITISPFAFRARQVLVVAPNVQIAEQLYRDFDQTQQEGRFYVKCRVLNGQPYPEPVPIRGRTTNLGDIEASDVVITNIQQLQGDENRWLERLPQNFFDLILFDEAHHNVAASWEMLRRAFPDANIVNFSATPVRADGQRMAGTIIYSYPIVRAIQEGYIKRLKALVLNPRTLRFVRRTDNQEVEVSLEEVRNLGETDADFRRSIVTSEETLTTIVDASIRELERIRTDTGDQRHKIIASALNYEHCIQIVQAYQSRGRRAGYIHSNQDGAANQRVLTLLDNHELDVIVQVRKLGEGFDHPYLSVAAIFSIFANLGPFVQFVGRIMRVIEQNNPNSAMNQGTVVFHAGANIARRWEDFQQFSQADQEFFDRLLPLEGLEFADANEIAVDPTPPVARRQNEIEVRGQENVLMQEIPLLAQDEEAMRAFQVLRDRGFSADDYRRAVELEPVPTTRVRQRQAARVALDNRVRNDVGLILRQRNVNTRGRELDRTRRQNNFVYVKSAIDRRIYDLLNRGPGQRDQFTQPELDQIAANYDNILAEVVREVFGA